LKRMLFIGHQESTFCVNDEKILAKGYEVSPLHIPAVGRKMLILLPLRIFKRLRHCDLVYIWFGSIPAAIAVFIAKLLGKPSIVVAGGYDVANEPDMNYGLLSKPLLRPFPKFAFNKCDIVLAVSDFTRQESLSIVRDGHKVITVPNGIDTSRFYIQEEMVRERVITVGNVNRRTWIIKGFNNFVDVARKCPGTKFVLVGKVEPGIIENKPENLELVGPRYGDELVRVLNSCKYYLQLSYRESFGVAVIESMACGCIPIVTDRGGLPEAVGDIGVTVPFGQWDKVAEAIQMEYDPFQGAMARKRVVQLYDMKVRERAVLDEVRKLLSQFGP